MSLLILGSQSDKHVETVVKKISDLGVKSTIIDPYIGKKYDLALNNSGNASLIVDGLEVKNPKLIWKRVKLSPYRIPEGSDFRTNKLIVDEWLHFYGSVIATFTAPVVNEQLVKSESQKFSQLILAQKLGFNIPPTLVTTAKKTALKFSSKHDDLINKKPGPGSIPKPDNPDKFETIFTSRVTGADIKKSTSEEFSFCPVFLQKEIKKKYELRVVCIYDEIFAFKINSQDHRLSEVDWRYKSTTLDFMPCSIHEDTKDRIIAFLRSLNLFYGSFDFIVDSRNQYWFLECNQDGQWMWLDLVVRGSISSCFAEKFNEHYFI